MPSINDLKGKVFGMWTVVQFDRVTKQGAYWICRCECGNHKSIVGKKLPERATRRKCYCRNKEHGMKGTQVYNSWAHMIQRCTNKRNPDFVHYGARGITVCSAWRSFTAFLADVGTPPGPNFSLGRVDNNAGYTPENCRWETVDQQRRNTRRNRILSYKGKTQCLAEWARDLGVDHKTLSSCIKYGMPVHRVLNPRTWPNAVGRTHY